MRQQRAQDLRAAVDRLPLSTRQNMLRGLEEHNIIVGADGNVRGGRCPMMAASVGSSKVTGKPFARAWDAYAGVRLSRPATRHELQTLQAMLVASIDAETEQPVDLAEAVSNFSVVGEARAPLPAAPAPAVTHVQAAPAPQATPHLPVWSPVRQPPAGWTEDVVPTRRRSWAAGAADEEPVDLRAAIAAHMASKERTLAAERAHARPPKARRPERRDTGERDRTEELENRHGWSWLRPFRRLDDFERAVQQLEEAERVGIAALRQHGDVGGSDRPTRREGREPVGTPPGGY